MAFDNCTNLRTHEKVGEFMFTFLNYIVESSAPFILTRFLFMEIRYCKPWIKIDLHKRILKKYFDTLVTMKLKLIFPFKGIHRLLHGLLLWRRCDSAGLHSDL